MLQTHQILRRLIKAPGFTVTILFTLVIAIGATTAIFAVVNGVLIQPLPFERSDRLIALEHRQEGADTVVRASPAIYFAYRDNNRTFESVALWFTGTAAVNGSGDPEEVRVLRATYEFLPTLRVKPALGRGFTAADDQPGSPKTVILSDDYWQRHFNGDSGVVGRTLVIDGVPTEVIGVLPRGFRFDQRPADILGPAQLARAIAYAGPTGERGIARLKDAVTLAEASADVQRMIPIMQRTFPLAPWLTRAQLENSRFVPNLRPLKDSVVGDLGNVLWVLMATIGILLLIACANVANLQIVRTDRRAQEIAIQTALGASARTIASNLLVESVIIGFAGGLAGLMLATSTLPMFLSLAAEHLPYALQVTIGPTVVAFTLTISLGSGLLLGLIPAVSHAGPKGIRLLGGAGRSSTPSRERHRVRSLLVVAQVAMSLVLLVAAGLMIRTFQSLRQVKPGLTQSEKIQVATISIPQAAVPNFDRVVRMQNDIQDRLSEVVGVESVGFASKRPFTGSGPTGPYYIENKPEVLPGLEFRYTSPGLFQSWGTPLVAGRTFEWNDVYNKFPAVVISESLARREWGSGSAALGKRLRSGPTRPWLEIIGVVGDIRHAGLDQPAPDTVYVSSGDFTAQYVARSMSFFVRSDRVGTAGFMQDIQKAIWSVNANLPLGNVQTMGDIYSQSMGRTSLTLVLLAITASMALILGLVGIYAVISYALAQRTREIGIRMALGAHNATLKRMLLRQVVSLVAAGVVLGLAGAAGMSRIMTSLLFGVTTIDPTTYVAVSALLIGTALLAGYLPARRITNVDPMRALRQE
jgi:putative ABC transport system permease protein